MDYYDPSYRQGSRIFFKRRRSKKPILLAALVFMLMISFFLVGFGSNSSTKQYNPSQHPENSTQFNTNSHPGTEITSLDISGTHGIEPRPKREYPAGQDPSITALEGHETGEPLVSIEEKKVTVANGDTLMELLVREGLERSEAHNVIVTLQKVFNPRRIRQGQEVTLAFEHLDNYDPMFQNMNLKLDVTRSVQVARCPENGFVVQDLTFELGTRPVRAEAEINSSLYNAAINAGMPIEVLMQMIRAYSFDIDFQRDIQPGDQFAVLFEELVDGNGEFVRGGSVLFANLNTRGRSLPIYRYETSDGEVDFFNDKGQSVRKTLMVTPIDGARLSSGYGKRRHPILGYSRMHQGLDFAAPTGTPIMAAGDGVVEYAGRKGNYGNYIRLRHPNEYHTVYAHMSRFASGIRQGARVKQGEIIGYVGSTGLSTGPHLHYEVHHRGSHVNPASVVSPPGRTLKGEELERFMSAKKDLETLFASLEKCEKVAMAEH
jgi:murein DD-endopeptidase MepM/ murein hydrolase activator NlpD